MRKILLLALILAVGLVAGVSARKLTTDVVARHLHMAGVGHDGGNTACLDCHGIRGQSEVPFSGGRISNMGGGDDCLRCHDGTHPKAPDFSPILDGTETTSCADCHITTTKGRK